MVATKEVSDLSADSENWSPSLSDKQWLAMNNKSRLLLLSGPRFSGKSIVLAHKTIMTAYDLYEGNIGIIVSSYKVATSGGAWNDVVDCAREWMNAGIVSEYGHRFTITSKDANGNPGSKLEGTNRTPYLTIRNKFGTETTIRLISMDNENEVEKKLKTTRFQFIWIVELSNFIRREIVCVAEDQLRPTLLQSDPSKETYWPDERCQLVADTNPPKEGKKHWIYQWWFAKDSGNFDPQYQKQVEMFARKMEVIEIFLDDNTFLPATKKDELIGKYAGDPDLFTRFVLGEYPDGCADKTHLFGDVFTDNLILEGQIECDDLTDMLITGQDLGPKNKAWVLLERRIVEDRSVWSVLDELVYLDEYVSTEEFTMQVLAKLIRINDFYKERWRNFKGFKFEHWSDSSSWNLSLNDESGTEALEVFNASNGQIELRPVDKPAKSVEVGCQIIRKLMREERFFMGSNTPYLRKSLQNIRRSVKAGKTIDPGDPLKHVCDALRYPIYMIEAEEMSTSPVQPKNKWKERHAVVMPLY